MCMYMCMSMFVYWTFPRDPNASRKLHPVSRVGAGSLLGLSRGGLSWDPDPRNGTSTQTQTENQTQAQTMSLSWGSLVGSGST